MRRLTTLIGLLPPTAQAELDELVMTQAEIQTFACARYEQLFEAYGSAFLGPGVRDALLQRVRARGASEAQIARIGRVYNASRTNAAAEGLEAGSRAAAATANDMTMLEREATLALGICFGQDPWQIERIELAAKSYDERDWKERAKHCADLSMGYHRQGVGYVLEGLKTEMLSAAGAAGASSVQLKELDKEFGEARALAIAEHGTGVPPESRLTESYLANRERAARNLRNSCLGLPRE